MNAFSFQICHRILTVSVCCGSSYVIFFCSLQYLHCKMKFQHYPTLYVSYHSPLCFRCFFFGFLSLCFSTLSCHFRGFYKEVEIRTCFQVTIFNLKTETKRPCNFIPKIYKTFYPSRGDNISPVCVYS